MGDIAIRVEGLSKRYRIRPPERYRLLSERFTRLINAPTKALGWSRYGREPNPTSARTTSTGGPDGTDHIWALKDVSFEVKRGDVVGIIGRNGAGKTTLLKILARITDPTEGYAEISGRVGSLLEVGTGFHPELTGRENIYLNGAILGMKMAEIDRRFDAIVQFAETERFLDTPVKHYSTGMYMRLAFSVAAHLDPEILLVDEVLAVGDTAFQRKCLGKMGDVASEGRTVLFVTHNMAAIQSFCLSGLLLERGHLAANGETATTVQAYIELTSRVPAVDLGRRTERTGTGLIRFDAIELTSGENGQESTVLSGDKFNVILKYSASFSLAPSTQILVGVSIRDALGDAVFLCSNRLTGQIESDWPDRGTVVCSIPEIPLLPGSYSINAYVSVGEIVADWVVDAARFDVESADWFGTGRLPPSTHGRVIVRHSWHLESRG